MEKVQRPKICLATLLGAFVGLTLTLPAERALASTVLAAGYALPAGVISLELARRSVEIDGRVRSRKAVSATFEFGGEAITVETTRGLRPKFRSLYDPEAPKYAIDVCFKDSEGRPFLVQVGGDTVLDPSCDPELQQEPPELGAAGGSTLTTASSPQQFVIAQALTQALETVEFRGSLEPEYRALVGNEALAAEAQSALADEDCNAEGTVCEDGGVSGAEVGPASHLSWRHIIVVYEGEVSRRWRDLVGIGYASHGATVAFRQHSSNRIDTAWHRCNHGRCYYETGMQRRYNRKLWTKLAGMRRAAYPS